LKQYGGNEMGRKKLVGIILLLALCASLVTPALANDETTGNVRLTVSDTQGVILLVIERTDCCEVVSVVSTHNPTYVSLDVESGPYVDLMVITREGYTIESWEVSTDSISLNRAITVTEEPEDDTVIIHVTWFIMPNPAVSVEIQAVVVRDEQQAPLPSQRPQTPVQTPGTPIGTPTRPAEEISVHVDGGRLDLEVPPYLLDGRTLVPLRAIFEALGAHVNWEAETQTIYAQKDGISITLMIGSNIMLKNGVSYEIDVAPIVMGGRTLVPTRLIAESFGATVNWEPETRTVDIFS